jgi:hypothetical protein
MLVRNDLCKAASKTPEKKAKTPEKKAPEAAESMYITMYSSRRLRYVSRL